MVVYLIVFKRKIIKPVNCSNTTYGYKFLLL